jgi:nicotinamidase-related amidase
MCIKSTARRALALKYDVTVVSDGHSTFRHKDAANIIAGYNAALANEGAHLQPTEAVTF